MDIAQDVRVSCLSTICDLHRICEDKALKLSDDSNRLLLKLTLNRLGPALSQKLAQI
ncbi:hypothetical protein LSH36_244g01029 [Paralvinella palmiformis]|uniref:Uncharacterized protein n=1 Tax=Paralvinella palmiformis TaxID=53620 RepID=A0AAD9JLE8_9ANNE|nr:hypothetical protein LSH36_244g01029 [Paralvinella palmiformis]